MRGHYTVNRRKHTTHSSLLEKLRSYKFIIQCGSHYILTDRLSLTSLVIILRSVRGRLRAEASHPLSSSVWRKSGCHHEDCQHCHNNLSSLEWARHVPNNVTSRGDYYTIFPDPHTITHSESGRKYWELRGCIKILCSFTAPWLTSCKVSQICNMSADTRQLKNISESNSQKPVPKDSWFDYKIIILELFYINFQK